MFSDPWFEEGGATEERLYISAHGRLVAQINRDASGSTIYYAHTDLLGSVEALTDASGALVSTDSKSFDAFGDARAADWTGGAADWTGGTAAFANTGRGYTGHETDVESGLINMNARLYDPLVARFVSADTLVSDTYDPQNLNRYSYVLNNPLRYIDPTGNSPFDNTFTTLSSFNNEPDYPGQHISDFPMQSGEVLLGLSDAYPVCQCRR